MQPPLQPLRVTSGWTMLWNNWLAIDPADVSDEDRCTFHVEDLIFEERVKRLTDETGLGCGIWCKSLTAAKS